MGTKHFALAVVIRAIAIGPLGATLVASAAPALAQPAGIQPAVQEVIDAANSSIAGATSDAAKQALLTQALKNVLAATTAAGSDSQAAIDRLIATSGLRSTLVVAALTQARSDLQMQGAPPALIGALSTSLRIAQTPQSSPGPGSLPGQNQLGGSNSNTGGSGGGGNNPGYIAG